MTDTKPTVELLIADAEFITAAIMAAGGSSLYAKAILASLKEPHSIRSAEMPVEPHGFAYIRQCYNDDRKIALSHFERDAIEHIDALKLCIHNRDAELAALRGRLMEPEHKQKCDLLGQPVIGAMSAVALKEGKC